MILDQIFSPGFKVFYGLCLRCIGVPINPVINFNPMTVRKTRLDLLQRLG